MESSGKPVSFHRNGEKPSENHKVTKEEVGVFLSKLVNKHPKLLDYIQKNGVKRNGDVLKSLTVDKIRSIFKLMIEDTSKEKNQLEGKIEKLQKQRKQIDCKRLSLKRIKKEKMKSTRDQCYGLVNNIKTMKKQLENISKENEKVERKIDKLRRTRDRLRRDTLRMRRNLENGSKLNDMILSRSRNTDSSEEEIDRRIRTEELDESDSSSSDELGSY